MLSETIMLNNTDEVFMVMEYCGGGDLHKYYHTESFTNEEFVRVMAELLSGISYLHQRRIAHRDLKPANILLESGTMRVKIADFGLAKGSAQTATKGIGTPAYMAPEMFVEEKASKTDLLAGDVYSLAVITWELWYRAAPFRGVQMHRVIAQVMQGKRLPFTEIEDDTVMEPALRILIENSWKQDPANRPSVSQVSRTFKAIFPAAHKVALLKAAPKMVPVRSLNGFAEEKNSTSWDLVNDPAAQKLGYGRRLSKLGCSLDMPSKNIEDFAQNQLRSPTAHNSRTQPRSKAPMHQSASALGAHSGMTVSSFLQSAGLAKFAEKLNEFGFTDLDMLSDRELLDDDTLIGTVGMSKQEVRTFRARIEAAGSSPTLQRSQFTRDATKDKSDTAASLTGSNGKWGVSFGRGYRESQMVPAPEETLAHGQRLFESWRGENDAPRDVTGTAGSGQKQDVRRSSQQFRSVVSPNGPILPLNQHEIGEPSATIRGVGGGGSLLARTSMATNQHEIGEPSTTIRGVGGGGSLLARTSMATNQHEIGEPSATIKGVGGGSSLLARNPLMQDAGQLSIGRSDRIVGSWRTKLGGNLKEGGLFEL
jgi:serine/threonine protein kinase